MEEILRAAPTDNTVTAYVAEKEALTIQGEDGDEAIDLESMISAGLIQIVTLETEIEHETALTIVAAVGGQGEAETGAIAIHRNWCMATDDKKARNFLARMSKELQIIYTLEIVKHWADSCAIPDTELRTVLQNIHIGGNYSLKKSHPLYDWWQQFML